MTPLGYEVGGGIVRTEFDSPVVSNQCRQYSVDRNGLDVPGNDTLVEHELALRRCSLGNYLSKRFSSGCRHCTTAAKEAVSSTSSTTSPFVFRFINRYSAERGKDRSATNSSRIIAYSLKKKALVRFYGTRLTQRRQPEAPIHPQSMGKFCQW